MFFRFFPSKEKRSDRQNMNTLETELNALLLNSFKSGAQCCGGGDSAVTFIIQTLCTERGRIDNNCVHTYTRARVSICTLPCPSRCWGLPRA